MDTISKQYERYRRHESRGQHEGREQYQQHKDDDSKLYQDHYEGGGAPWES